MGTEVTDTGYRFTNNWFEGAARRVWDGLIPQIKPARILEIGSYEGASACYLVQKLAAEIGIEIHCVDTWAGGIEHQEGGAEFADMSAVERRFDHNIHLAQAGATLPIKVIKHKGFSDEVLARLLSEGLSGYFDWIYVDGSHQAPDVLCDALLGFRLLKIKGIMVFDDYLWSETLPGGVDPIRCPKPAIDAFTNIYCRKLRIIQAPLYQLYIQKLSD
jgi:predicted O-methyltransferase YrrM